ncbi:asparagine synthase (glutamine-hydrolyzing) [Singulisphaera sp. Ch08]|uniref:asparagine synthase (glutamine-hydrolyzing) n=1 Tax=Singulisphaera sp. Ch08 TaxID=3120278 RepID=A0AAU7CM64_9BACT
MCGIAGIVSSSALAQGNLERVRAMAAAQAHRGPDDGGVEVVREDAPAVVFGHRRLAIIDLSPAGHQPMLDPESGSWITFNGEIYNYRELRLILEREGYTFRTATDTEVILKAFAHWGEDCVRQLRGIFAFAIFRPESRGGDGSGFEVFLARDQLGVKPLYYWFEGGTLVFASEVRAVLASDLVERRLDLLGLRSYLAYGSVQEPYTLVQGVQSLPPGHTLVWRDGQLETSRYWRLPEAEQVSATGSADVLDELSSLLSEAVRIQMVADVPVGAFLSGGIDSTAIAALAQRASTQPIRTFCVVFDEASYDEREYALAAARHIGTQHAELHLSDRIVRESLDRALGSFDQPSMDGLNTYFVSQVTREAGLTVALSGVGGDELFGGYDGYHRFLQADRWGRLVGLLPGAVRSGISPLVSGLARNEAQRKAALLLKRPHSSHLLVRQFFHESQIRSLVPESLLASPASWEAGAFAEVTTAIAGYDVVNRASAWELQTYMLSTLLRDTDQMSMAHALEVRVPLLDHLLIEFLFSLPGSLKLKAGQPKPLLTLPLGDALPAKCVHRRKQGFELPFEVWFRRGLQDRMREFFLGTGGRSNPLFLAAGLARLWRQFEAGRVSWSRVWCLYVLQRWLEEHRVTV